MATARGVATAEFAPRLSGRWSTPVETVRRLQPCDYLRVNRRTL